ncbi:hypothetical protein ACSFA7_32700 [Variovorax sp. LT1R20]|uniref:hypothetical protein n=1 Tax=Variovorax sp. LT1R20 TaxID=3443729 RepID=UPI003F48DABA
MARSLSPDREREFQELLAFISFYAEHVEGVRPTEGFNMETVCAGIVAQYGKSKALEGLRQAANDIIEDLSDRPADGVTALDEALSAAGLLTASEVRRRYAASYKRIVKRGSIRNDTEYYLIKGIVVDLASALSQEERSALQQLLDAYETTGRHGK